MRHRKPVMSGKQKIGQHAVEVEIDEMGAVAEEELLVDQHLLIRHEFFLQTREEELLLGAPLLQAAAAELAFLVAEECHLFGFRHKLLPVNVIELEGEPFDFALDVPPDNRLHPFQLPRE